MEEANKSAALAISKATSIKTVLIKNTSFAPALVRCEADTIVRWVVDLDKERNNKSLYYDTTRGHVIGFEDLEIESGFLTIQHLFEVQFHQPGIFKYKCLIFPSMTGVIEIVPGTKCECVNAGNARKVFTMMKADAKPIEKQVESSPLKPKHQHQQHSIKEIVKKYLQKADRMLAPNVELELDNDEDSELDIFEGQHAILKELLSMNMETVWKKAGEYKKTNAQLEIEANSRKGIISSCMNMY